MMDAAAISDSIRFVAALTELVSTKAGREWYHNVTDQLKEADRLIASTGVEIIVDARQIGDNPSEWVPVGQIIAPAMRAYTTRPITIPTFPIDVRLRVQSAPAPTEGPGVGVLDDGG